MRPVSVCLLRTPKTNLLCCRVVLAFLREFLSKTKRKENKKTKRKKYESERWTNGIFSRNARRTVFFRMRWFQKYKVIMTETQANEQSNRQNNTPLGFYFQSSLLSCFRIHITHISMFCFWLHFGGLRVVRTITFMFASRMATTTTNGRRADAKDTNSILLHLVL